jgi:hypothetical protein
MKRDLNLAATTRAWLGRDRRRLRVGSPSLLRSLPFVYFIFFFVGLFVPVLLGLFWRNN